VTDKIPLLAISPLLPEHEARLADLFDLTYAPTPAQRAAALAAHGAKYRVLLSIGVIPVAEEEIAAMPKLELACCMGVGYEGLPMAALRARGIVTANGAGTNENTVADHTFGLIIGIVRNIRLLDQQCRAGIWRDAVPQPPQVSGRRLGIFGMGSIGGQIARRAAGFDMPIGYHNRKPVDGSPHQYFDDIARLADWADILVCVAPGGASTRHKVDARVLDALGPTGYLVNVGRGSLVDTGALAAALRDRRIAGAAIDVYESEPQPPEQLIGLDNLIITPHLAGWSPEATLNSVNRFIANAEGHFSGRGVVSPI
jgi:lactate dehydrogenase-like 2-hydroxyacid dehydrogenase